MTISENSEKNKSNDLGTQSIFWWVNFGGAGWLACMLAGWHVGRRFLVLVIKVITFGVLIFSYQKQRQLHVRISEPQIEVPKILRIEQNDQNQRKSLFYFSALRGRGKSSAMISEVELTHFLILFFFGVSK